MKTRNIILSFCAAAVLFGCDSYLDRQPDQALDLKAVFESRTETEEYLYNVFSFMPIYWNPGGYDSENVEAWFPASDEGIFSYNRSYRKINEGSMNPSNMAYNNYGRYYQGIREANIFMQNVDNCDELTPQLKLRYKTEARFCRAYYYFLLMRQYGPIILVGDVPLPDKDATYNVPRNPWDECVLYVENEFTEIAALLPATQESQWGGKPTSGAALAVKAQLLLYAASPLFNPTDPDNYIYKDVENSDGTKLFPQEYDLNKWKKAATACREVINTGKYKLMDYSDKRSEALYHTFWDTNTEMIWGRNIGIQLPWIQSVTPRQVRPGSSYGGGGLTQNQIDAYGMAESGRYPITGYEMKGGRLSGANPVIDVNSGYSEDGFVTFNSPVDATEAETFRMYTGRDPRFYRDVVWAGMPLKNGNPNVMTIEFYTGSGSGPGLSHDYSPAGYLARKFTLATNNPQEAQWGTNNVLWPYLRYAEILLMCAEALNEYDPGNTDILTYVNMVRQRVGVAMPPLEQAYPEKNLGTPAGQADMRDLIKRERRVELSFEAGQRYFDIRRWMDAEKTMFDAWGMNVFAITQAPGSNFWERTLVERRAFSPKNYLYPFPQNEMNFNKELVQNYGW